MKHLTSEEMKIILNQQYKNGFIDPTHFDTLPKQRKVIIVRKYINTCLANYALTIGENYCQPDVVERCVKIINDYSACMYGLDRYINEYYN